MRDTDKSFSQFMCGRLLRCKGKVGVFLTWSGAVMCPACLRGTWPLALMKSTDRVPNHLSEQNAHEYRRVVSISGTTGRHHVTIHPRILEVVCFGLGGGLSRFAIDGSARQDGPGDARHLVGERDRDEAGGFGFQQLDEPSRGDVFLRFIAEFRGRRP